MAIIVQISALKFANMIKSFFIGYTLTVTANMYFYIPVVEDQ